MKKMRLQQAVEAFLLLVFLVSSLEGMPADTSVLPKCAFSIPAEGDVTEALKAAEQCGLTDKVLVLPSLVFNLNGENEPGNRYDVQEKILGAMPEDTEAYFHVKLRTGGVNGQEQEKAVNERVTDFLKRLPLSAARARGLIVEIEEPLGAVELARFALADLAVKAKGSKQDLKLIFFLPPGFIGRYADLVKRLAIYADSLGIVFAADWRSEATWIVENALNKPVVLRLPDTPSAEPERAGVSYVDAVVATSGTSVDVIWADARDVKVLGQLCATANFLARSIGSEFISVLPAASAFAVAAQGVEPSEHKFFVDRLSQDVSILAEVKGSRDRPNSISLLGPATGEFDVQWLDPVSGRKLAPGEVAKTDEGSTQSCLCDTEYALILIHKLGTPEERARTVVEVRARADLTVEEIIARWQQYREAQRQKLENSIAACFMNLHFTATSIGSGFDISMQFKQFANRAGLVEWAQTEFYVNGVKFKDKREFPLPQLEPEKVMTQPLELKLNEKYQYRLLGTDQVDGIACYVVGVEPKEGGETLYSGRIWIDGTTFRQVRLQLRQRGAKSNVIVNDETQSFDLVSDGKGNQFNLIKSIYAQQTLNAAGRNFILEKTYKFSDYALNVADFDAALAAAHQSDSPMYRDTQQGLRVLRKEGDQRVLQATGDKRVKSIIGGAFYEGTFNFPIPLFGMSLVDFNFRNTNSQLSLFFAGPILATNLSKQWASRYRLGLDLALSALPENNRVYSGNTEVKEENVWVFEESTGVRATWQATTNLSLTAASHFAYDFFRATGDTSKQYVLPRNGLTLLPNAEIKYVRQGYNFTATALQGRRIGWKAFGEGQDPVNATYTKYSGDFSKNFYFGKFTKAGIELAYYGGDRLDRFSRYRPSFFSLPRIRGIPNGTDSFDAIALGSANFGFNVMELIKFEGFYNYARARNKTESRYFRQFDGLEFDFGTAGPWGTYLQGTTTFALRGNLERYNSRWGVYFIVFKPLR
jgi:hypothetical protein